MILKTSYKIEKKGRSSYKIEKKGNIVFQSPTEIKLWER